MSRVDAALALVVLLGGGWIGVRAVHAFRAAGGQQYFYQSDFGPAVLVACGGGLADPDTAGAPALAAFLAQRTDAFDCRDLPASLRTVAMNPFQAAIRYLEMAVALTWKLTGVSWSRLALLNGVMFGAVAALTFVILRLALPLPLALALLVPSVTSTPNFMLVPHLRDYAKGPFLLAAIAIMVALVTGAAISRRTVALATVGGLVVGVGLGFRADLVLAIAPFVITLAFLVPAAVSAAERVVAILVFVLTVAVVAFPVLRIGAGGNNGHVMLLGLASEFDGPLRIQPSVYTFGGPYVDALAATTIDAYGIRVEGHAATSAMSADYERLASGYLGAIASTFPADVITRGLAAVRTVSKYFLDSSLYPPIQVRSDTSHAWYALRARVWWRLGQIALAACAAATLLVAAVNPRAAWLIVVVMVGFAGASAIQFNERHFYYLQFVPWLAFGVLANTALSRRRLRTSLDRGDAVRATRFAAIVGVTVAAAVAGTRLYQQRSAARLFARYEAASRTPVATSVRSSGAGRATVSAPEWLGPLPPDTPSFSTRFVAMELHDRLCGAERLPLTLRYDGRRRDADLSETIYVAPRPDAPSPTIVFVAAYDWSNDYVRFRGIEVPAGRVDCIAGVFRVGGLEHEPLLLTARLADGWSHERLYQRIHD